MSDKFYSDFYMELRKGKNIDVIESGIKFFSAHGIEIESYYIAVPSISKNVEEISKEHLNHSCDCCKTDLVRLTSAVYVDGDEEEDIKVRPKRHLVWVDKKGNTYKTCYKKKLCLDKANERLDKYRGAVISSPEITLQSFWKQSNLGLDHSTTYLSKERLFRLEKTFLEIVSPFLKKWSSRSIDKSNVISFIDDFEGLKKHASLYPSANTQALFVDKVIILIGATK